MNIPRKISRQGPSFEIEWCVCDYDISQEKHRLDQFRAKSQREGVLKYLQRILLTDKLPEDNGLSRYIIISIVWTENFDLS
jgi:hypothetical protein